MGKIEQNFVAYFEKSTVILTEGAIGLRISHEFDIIPDRSIRNASLIYDSAGRKALEIIYRQYLQIAEDYSLPIMLMTNTRRTNRETIAHSQYKDRNVISDYADFLREIAEQYHCNSFIGGIIGCKGDAYSGTDSLSIYDAISFHKWQIDEFKKAKVDFIFEAIMPVISEIIGISTLIGESEIPYITSFMVRKNGEIIDGHTIHDAITTIDNSLDHKPLCYMANCIHPDILRSALSLECNDTVTVKTRFKGIQANAAYAEPEELDSLHEVKASSAEQLTNSFMLLDKILKMKIYGGCCGTNDIHIKRIAEYLHSL